MGEVERGPVWRDETENYIGKRIGQILSQRDYKAIALIDTKSEILFFWTYYFQKMLFETKVELAYQDVMEQLAEQRITKYGKSRFMRCSNLKFLIENLKLAEQYSHIFD